MQNKFTLLLLLFATLSFSQTITLKGKVTDPDDIPLEAATIYISSVTDSTLVEYTISDRNGNWELRLRKTENPIYLKVSFMGFANYTEQLEGITEDKDFGTIKMSEQSTDLSEVIIVGEVPPIRIKSDTLEFNAASFKVRPDSNVQTLLKQLPGVEIDEEGKITVNGKEVNQILVNGKPFFDKDGKIALQNLPAEIIDKIQVTDKKSRAEELSGQKASSDDASINLTIQEDKNKGLFGKFMGGYGSSDRYESSALFNYFKDKQKISILASSNNINSTGFSMNEIFDNMGGGRNMMMYTSSNGSFGINGMRFGGNTGITLSNMIGVNYADEWVKDLESNVSYFYTSAETDNENRTRQVNFLPTDGTSPGGSIDADSFTTESSSVTRNTTYAHNFNTQFEFKIDSTSTIFFEPKYTLANSKNSNLSSQFSVDGNNQLLNESEGHVFTERDNSSFANNLYYFKGLRKKGRSVSVSLNNENSKDDATNLNESSTFFYGETDGVNGIVRTDIRNQVRYNRQAVDSYGASFEYAEPITDSLTIRLNVGYDTRNSVEDRQGFDFDEQTGMYTSLNDSLTNYLTSRVSTLSPSAGINIRKEKLYFNINLGTDISRFDNFSTYLGQDYTFDRNYILPNANAFLSYRITKSRSIYSNYSYNVSFPAASQVLPVEDVSNPLFTTVGNPDLDPNRYHSISFSYRDYDYTTRSGYSIYAGGDFYDSQVMGSTIIDESAKRTTTFENVSGTLSSWLGGNWSKSIKREAHNFRFGLGVNINYFKNKGFTNGELFEEDNFSITPRANFSYDYGELLNIAPSYNYTIRRSDYTNYIINSQSNSVHNVNLQTTTYWPKHVIFGNDFGYTYTTNIAPGFRRDFFLWNTSLGYNFFNDKLLFKVKVYDLLNQNLNATRTITATGITDQQNIVLRRYVMFTLTYKIEKFGGKKEGGSRRFSF